MCINNYSKLIFTSPKNFPPALLSKPNTLRNINSSFISVILQHSIKVAETEDNAIELMNYEKQKILVLTQIIRRN